MAVGPHLPLWPDALMGGTMHATVRGGSGGRSVGFWNQLDLVGILPLLLTGVTVGTLHSVTDSPQQVAARIKRILHGKSLAPCLAHSKHSGNVGGGKAMPGPCRPDPFHFHLEHVLLMALVWQWPLIITTSTQSLAL